MVIPSIACLHTTVYNLDPLIFAHALLSKALNVARILRCFSLYTEVTGFTIKMSETYDVAAGARSGYPCVSVIVPIYNIGGGQLVSLLDCAVGQTLKDIEIICIDDGSTDDSAATVKCYCAKDARIKYYRQEHTGAGAARNKGITLAHGKYIAFWDADDLYDPAMLESMSKALENSGAEIGICKAERVDAKAGKRSNYFTFTEKITPGLNTKDVLQPNLFQLSFAPWNKMFLRELIVKYKIEFQDLPWANDLYFVGRALSLAENVHFLEESYVLYRYNTDKNISENCSNHPLCAVEAWIALRVQLLSEGNLLPCGIRSLNLAYYNALFNNFKRFVNDADASAKIHKLFSRDLLTELESYKDQGLFSLKDKIRLWCIERTSLQGLRWAYRPIGDGSRYHNSVACTWSKIRLALAGIFCM